MQQKKPHQLVRLFCAPTGIRTPVLALKGLRPRPLDDEGEQGRILAGLVEVGKFWQARFFSAEFYQWQAVLEYD